MSADVIAPGRVAVVTGGGSGIGRALCERFAARGMAVVVADIERAAGLATVDFIRIAGGDATFVPVDVADAGSVTALADATIDAFGRVDVLCNNAGVSTFNLMRDQTLDDWRWVLDVDLWGVVHGLHTFLPVMRDQGTRGHVVNTSSMGGLMGGVPFIGPYVAAKAAVIAISETLAREHEVDGTDIGVSVLCPGSTDTAVMESERTRPGTRGTEARTETAEAVRLMIKGTFTADTGKPAGEVADLVLDAIGTDRFWVISHPFERPLIEGRTADILEAFPPLP